MKKDDTFNINDTVTEEQLIKDIQQIIDNTERDMELDKKRLLGTISPDEYKTFISSTTFVYITLTRYAKFKLGDDHHEIVQKLLDEGEEDYFQMPGEKPRGKTSTAWRWYYFWDDPEIPR